MPSTSNATTNLNQIDSKSNQVFDAIAVEVVGDNVDMSIPERQRMKLMTLD